MDDKKIIIEDDDDDVINFIDLDKSSGKITTYQNNEENYEIPERVTELHNDVPMTDEMKTIVQGTYVEEQAKQKEIEQKAKEKANVMMAKVFVGILVAIGVIAYGIFSFMSLRGVENKKVIKEKTEFLVNNASYANDIKTYYTQLVNNADNYQNEVIFEASMKQKAKDVESKIIAEISTLEKNKESFEEFGAISLYDVIHARLDEVQKLAEFQQEGGEILDIVTNTNEFIVNENDNAEVYNKTLKEYLAENEIPYKESDGAIIYTVDERS